MFKRNKYEIQIPHHYCLEYSEGNKKMIVDIDFRDTVIYLDVDLIKKWNSPYSEEVIDKQKKEEIIRNIHDYLVNVKSFTNITLEI